MRPRRSNNNTNGNKLIKNNRNSTSSPENLDGIVNGNSDPMKLGDRKSPSVASTCSNSSTDKDSKDSNIDKKEELDKNRKRQNLGDSDTKAKKKKSQDPSDCDSVSDASSISGNDETGQDDDDDNNQDELSSSSPPTTPTPSEVDYQPLKDLVKPEPQHPTFPSPSIPTLPPKPVHMPEPNHFSSLPMPRPSQNSPFHHPHLQENTPMAPAVAVPAVPQQKPEEMVDKKPDLASLQKYSAMYHLPATHTGHMTGGPPPIPGLIPIKKEPLSPRMHSHSMWSEHKKDSDVLGNVNKLPNPSSHRESTFSGLPYPHHVTNPGAPMGNPVVPLSISDNNKSERKDSEIPSKPIHHVAPTTITSMSQSQHHALPPQDLSIQSNLFSRSSVSESKETSSVGSKDTTAETPLMIEPDDDSDTDSRPPSPGPDATPCNKEIHKSSSALFIQILSRGSNSCSRSDYIFKPLPDSKLAKKREDRERKTAHVQPMKEEKKRIETPPRTTSADAQVTSSISQSQHTPYSERHTPHPYSDTPALRQLHEYARPHAMGQDMRSPYGLGMPSPMDPFYRLAMYPPGSRERLELELERDKRERDARERELRERELREIELREKMKAEMEMKPPGLDRLVPGGNQIDPHWLELQRRYGYPPGMPMVGHPGVSGSGSHIPGVYPPTSLANDLMQREREKLERLGIPSGLHLLNPEGAPPGGYPYGVMERLQAERLQAEQLSLSGDPVARMQMGMASRAAAALAAHHTHAHSHTHLHLHQQQDRLLGLQQMAAANHYANMQPPSGADLSGPPGPSSSNPAISLANVPSPASQALLACNSREQELLQRELYSRAYMDPALAHQLSAQAAHHEAIQRQLMERERYGASGHMPPH